MKHINIRYYFITDCIEKYEPLVEWYPKSDMIGNFMEKPTQGVAFKRLWYQLMIVTEAQDPNPRNPKNIMKIK